jgi:hypothetical protein
MGFSLCWWLLAHDVGRTIVLCGLPRRFSGARRFATP